MNEWVSNYFSRPLEELLKFTAARDFPPAAPPPCVFFFCFTIKESCLFCSLLVAVHLRGISSPKYMSRGVRLAPTVSGVFPPCLSFIYGGVYVPVSWRQEAVCSRRLGLRERLAGRGTLYSFLCLPAPKTPKNTLGQRRLEVRACEMGKM